MEGDSMEEQQHPFQQDHVDVTNNFCDLKFVGLNVFQLSIFIVHKHAFSSVVPGTPHPPDPPETVEVLPLEGELLICLQ